MSADGAVPAEPDDAAGEDAEDRLARLELLEAENRRLREAYGRVRQTRHRRTALGLAGVGLVALVGAALFPAARVVLVVLGATGVFGGLLTWYLTPERFVAAEVGERVYAAMADNEASVAAELGLADRRVYLPEPDRPDREATLYVPQAADAAPPADRDRQGTFVVADDADRRGLALRPTGGPLLSELRRATAGRLADDPVALADQLAEGLREQFELVDGARPDVNPGEGRVTVAVSGSAYGDVTRFDHPVASLVAVGLAAGLEVPVTLTVDRTPEGPSEYLVTVRWAVEGDGGTASGAGEAAG